MYFSDKIWLCHCLYAKIELLPNWSCSLWTSHERLFNSLVCSPVTVMFPVNKQFGFWLRLLLFLSVPVCTLSKQGPMERKRRERIPWPNLSPWGRVCSLHALCSSVSDWENSHLPQSYLDFLPQMMFPDLLETTVYSAVGWKVLQALIGEAYWWLFDPPIPWRCFVYFFHHLLGLRGYISFLAVNICFLNFGTLFSAVACMLI